MAKVTIIQNGPILVEGSCEIYHGEKPLNSTENPNSVTALCRCGQTKNSPFCDGEHKACNFDIDTQK